MPSWFDVETEVAAIVRQAREKVLRIGFLILKHGAGAGDLRQTLLTLGRAALELGVDDLVTLVRYVLGEPNELEAGILHDVIEDGVRDGWTEEMLTERLGEKFGASVVPLVLELLGEDAVARDALSARRASKPSQSAICRARSITRWKSPLS